MERAVKTKTKPVTLPPLPAEVFTTFGPVAVRIVDDLRAPDDPNERLFGYWDGFARVISIRAGMHPTAAWLTLVHEQTHADIAEIGVKLSEDQEEAVCNAIAAARIAEMLAR
jgi:hypothetical protein